MYRPVANCGLTGRPEPPGDGAVGVLPASGDPEAQDPAQAVCDHSSTVGLLEGEVVRNR